jgi:hypothetical protein
MPLTEGDVIDVLSDPVALGIEFYVDNIHVKGEYFTTVRDHIRAGNILIKSGDSDHLALYDHDTDILLTQNKSPPLDDDDQGLLLHECVHAMIDVYYPNGDVTRHMGELAAYLTQTAFIVRKDPSAHRNGTAPWDKFWGGLHATVRSFKLDTTAGNGVKIPSATLEELRRDLIALPKPDADYGEFSKDARGVSNGLIRRNMFLSSGFSEPILARQFAVSHEVTPDPDGYLINLLTENYARSDVMGYGGRLRRLRRDFLYCSKPRAAQLRGRLVARRAGDRVSELFHDRLSHGGRAILLRVLALRDAAPKNR